MSAVKLWRRGGWTHIADRREVFPNDPGQGTPLMIEAPNGATATLLCVIDAGIVDDGGKNSVDVPNHVLNWLDETWEEANVWLYGNAEL